MKNKMYKRGFRFQASTLALAAAMLAQPAVAQGEAGGAGHLAIPIDEIVVTGTKRSTSLQETPVSISVFDANALEQAGIGEPADFLALVPNVNITSSVNAGDFLITMRGQASIRNAEPSVAVIIDGIKVATSDEFNSALFDLEQIEVLRGPQGAYYGRNASAGAIIINTKAPTEELSGSAKFSYGNNSAYEASGSLSGALIPEKLTARVSAAVKGSDGSYKNSVTDENVHRFSEEVGRARFHWDDGGPFTADLRIQASKARGGSFAYSPKVGIVPGLSPEGTIIHGKRIDNISANSDLDVPYVSDVPGRYEREVFNTALKLDYDFDFGVVTSITGFSKIKSHVSGKNFPYSNPSDRSTNYFGWMPVFGDRTQNSSNDYEQLSQEFRVTSHEGGFLEWQVGFDYTDHSRLFANGNTLNGALPAGITEAELAGYGGYNALGERTLVGGGNAIPFPIGIFGLDSPYPTTNFYSDKFISRNYAPFANVKLNLTDQLSLSVAGRYDIERRRVRSVGPDIANPFLGGASFNPCVRITGQSATECEDGIAKTFKQFQPKISLNYEINDSLSTYLSYGKSFKAGGFNSIGTRESVVQGRAALLESQGNTPEAARALAEAQVFTQDHYNKEVADTYEIGARGSFFDRLLRVSGALFWTDVKNAQLYAFDPVTFVQSIESIDKTRVKGIEIDANFLVTDWLTLFAGYGYVDTEVRAYAPDPSMVGNKPPYVAKDSWSLGGQLDIPLDDEKFITGRFEYNRTGRTEYSLNNDPDFARKPYDLVNVRLGIGTYDWQVSLWGNNIFNERYVNDITPVLPGAAAALSLAERRTFGAELRFSF